MIRKGQITNVGKDDVIGRISFIHQIFGLAALPCDETQRSFVPGSIICDTTALTVRLPGASIAPTRSIEAEDQTG